MQRCAAPHGAPHRSSGQVLDITAGACSTSAHFGTTSFLDRRRDLLRCACSRRECHLSYLRSAGCRNANREWGSTDDLHRAGLARKPPASASARAHPDVAGHRPAPGRTIPPRRGPPGVAVRERCSASTSTRTAAPRRVTARSSTRSSRGSRIPSSSRRRAAAAEGEPHVRPRGHCAAGPRASPLPPRAPPAPGRSTVTGMRDLEGRLACLPMGPGRRTSRSLPRCSALPHHILRASSPPRRYQGPRSRAPRAPGFRSSSI